MSEQLTFIDLFAGVGGFRRGMELAGHKCVGFCEWDKYAAMSYTSMHLATYEQIEKLKSLDKLKDRQKEIQKEEYKNGEWYSNDIRSVSARNVPKCDVWCFGAPCQDFSIAGNRAGLDGDRSSLVREVFRIIGEIEEESRPEWIIYENVKGMFSSNKGFDYLEILLAMDELGYDIEWQLFNSKDYGVPQNRERVYTIGHLRRYGRREILPIGGNNTEIDIIKELDIPQNILNDNERQRRVYSKNGIAPSVLSRTDSAKIIIAGKIDNNWSEQCKRVYDKNGLAPCLDTMQSGHREPKVAILGNVNPSGNGMNGNVFDSQGLSPTLTTNKGEGTKIAIPVLTPDRIEKRQNGRRFKEDGEPMFTLTAQDRHGVMVREATKQGFAIAEPGDSINLEQPNSKTRRERVGKEVAQTLTTSCNQATIDNMRIRKLTPKECFRLQGWTDDYFERAELVNSDSQLYKQAGNGVTVNVVYAIAQKLTS